jgi:hypothetical protein
VLRNVLKKGIKKGIVKFGKADKNGTFAPALKQSSLPTEINESARNYWHLVQKTKFEKS